MEQYLRETTQVAPRPRIQEQPKYYLIPKPRENIYLQQQEQQRQQLISPQQQTQSYLQDPYNPNSYYIAPSPPLNLSFSPYQALRPDTINQELIAALNKPAAVQIVSTTPKPKEEKETVQLLYVPVETLTKQEQQKTNWDEDTRRESQYFPQNPRLQSIQTDFAKQAQDAHKLQMQLQSGNVPVIYATTTTTTPKPVKKRKPHQPPLALYMGADHDVEVTDVLDELKFATSIAVQDNVGPETPKVFVGPSNLEVPNHFAKFELPYLNTVDNNRIQRKVDHLPFFVAPLSYKAPPGYSKIALPSPHVGSVVVNTNATPERITKKPPVVIEEEEDESSEEKPAFKYVPKYRNPSRKSEIDDEIDRRLAQTESLFYNQASKKQPVNLTVKSKSSTSITPVRETEETRSTTEEPRPVNTKQRVYSFEEPQNIRVTTEHVRASKPKTYTYSFEEPQEVHITSERPSRPYHRERVTSERPSRVTYSFEEPQEISITSPRPSAPRITYSFEEPQPVGVVSTESPRRTQSRPKYSSEEEQERKPYRQSSREEEDEEATKRQPQRTIYTTTERVRYVQTEAPHREDNQASYKKPIRENVSVEERDEEPPRRKHVRPREREESEENDEPAPRRQNIDRTSPRPRYEASATSPNSEESEEDVPEKKERPTNKLSYESTPYHTTPLRSYDEPKQPYQTSNRFISTTPVYILQTTEDDSERATYLVKKTDYSPTPSNYEGTYRNSEELNGRSSTPRYSFQREEETPIYSVTTGRPQVSATSEAPTYQAKFSPYLNLDVHVKAPGLHESSAYDLPERKPSGPNPYDHYSSKTASGERDSYNLPAHLPAINPEIPGLINNLQDQSFRQLLVPGRLVPTTEHLPVYRRPETTTPEYVSVTPLSYTTTTTPEPIIETTTQKRVRSRQRGGNRFSVPRYQDSSEVTAPPRRQSHRTRRPQLRQRTEQRREEHEHTSEYTPVRASHEYTTTEASRRDITHSPRQRVRSRTRPPHHESQEETRHIDETPRTPPPQPPPQSYIKFDKDQSTENVLQNSGVTDYHQTYVRPLHDASTSSREDNRPSVDVHVTHPEEHTEALSTPPRQYYAQQEQESSNEEAESVKPYEEITTTLKPRTRQRSRSRTRVTTTLPPATTRKPTITSTTTAKPAEKQQEEEFYGFIRPPSFNKPVKLDTNIPTTRTETPAYTDFDKRFQIPTYNFDFPAYNYGAAAHNHDDYYKELEAAGREPIQLYTNDKHLSSTPLYVFKPKFVLQTEDQQNVAATADPLRQEKEEARASTHQRTRLPQRRNQEVTAAATFNERGDNTRNKNLRSRGKSHFQLPASLRTASEEQDVQNSNYPAEFLQKQASVTQSSVFQITVEPQAQDSEYDQQPHSSIQRPSIALPDAPNVVYKEEEVKNQPEETSTIQLNAEETVTTLPPIETTSESEKKKGRRRGVWKLIKQRPVDNFETAESQNYHTAVQLATREKDFKKNEANLFDTLYEMFSSPEKDEASTEATTASSQIQSANDTSSEEVEATTFVPETEATTVTVEPNNLTTISENDAVTTEAVEAEETTTMKVLKPYEVAPWEMKAIKTSTTTEVSHETEICFRGRCVKSAGIAKTP